MSATNGPGNNKDKSELPTELMEQIVSCGNMTRAYKQVYQNQGSCGIDGMSVEELKPYMNKHWTKIKEGFSLSEVRGFTKDLDGWIRRHLRKIMWRQMKRNWKRRGALISRGLSENRAVISSFNQRGAWWNSGASHMNEAYPRSYFEAIGLASLHLLHSRFHPLPTYSKNHRDT